MCFSWAKVSISVSVSVSLPFCFWPDDLIIFLSEEFFKVAEVFCQTSMLFNPPISFQSTNEASPFLLSGREVLLWRDIFLSHFVFSSSAFLQCFFNPLQASMPALILISREERQSLIELGSFSLCPVSCFSLKRLNLNSVVFSDGKLFLYAPLFIQQLLSRFQNSHSFRSISFVAIHSTFLPFLSVQSPHVVHLPVTPTWRTKKYIKAF